MQTVSPEVLETAKKKLKDLNKDWTSGVCRGTCLSSVVVGCEIVRPHSACHAWVSVAYNAIKGYSSDRYSFSWHNEYDPAAKPFLTLSCHGKLRSKGICSEEAVDAIILWMARESPFSEFVLNRDDEESLLNGGVILLCGPGGLTQAQAMWVCKVLRYSVEGAKALDVWLALYKGGVNPLIAILVASYVRTISGATFGYTGASGHVDVFGGYEGACPIDVGALYSASVYPEADRTATVFSNPKTKEKEKFDKPGTVFRKFCKPLIKDDGWGGKIECDGADKESFIKAVLDWQKTFENQDEAVLPTSSTVYLDLDM